ncbi:hypothetical protein BDB00DRAFT_929691 [Zychaea mexicana]|uniref:uncharacterized protein n=1 Tax=Zychaea mexicana TaxID=64656 RepID=UPI0022FDC7CD|nr:uncharacterized protein BDB00DRAFT_929691 [Zychaea mexicana]KAI9492464.1 hypothetical protein BDB00DRAFT_929691 [Zychaea mexicana]
MALPSLGLGLSPLLLSVMGPFWCLPGDYYASRERGRFSTLLTGGSNSFLPFLLLFLLSFRSTTFFSYIMAETCPSLPVIPHSFKKSTRPLPHIFRLPNEILEVIILTTSRVQRDDDRQFLGWQYPEHQHTQVKRIALACRRFYALCVPYLWRDKEFILPREDDETITAGSKVQLATDILSRQTTQHYHINNSSSTNSAMMIPKRHFGSYVRSLCRDLTNGPHYDMSNSRLMAQLVCNLRALRIDFHPKARAEQYGLTFFVQSCPALEELYLENCRDTYDDFSSLLQYNRPLKSLTLLCCTIKENTLTKLVELNKKTLRRLMLQRVLLEKENQSQQQQIKNMTTASIVPLIPIPHTAYDHLFHHQQLTHLALSDALCYTMLSRIVTGSPNLLKLAIIVKESDPVLSARCILLIAQLRRLRILSLAFRSVHPLSTDYERLPCRAPSQAWSYFAQHMAHLRLIHVSASQLLLTHDFLSTLFHQASRLSQVMLHHVTHVKPMSFDEWTDHKILDAYRRELASAQNTMDAWRLQSHAAAGEEQEEWQRYFFTYEETQEKGFQCFEQEDHVCFVKGFEDWCESSSSSSCSSSNNNNNSEP